VTSFPRYYRETQEKLEILVDKKFSKAIAIRNKIVYDKTVI
jgi:hypothetical protein